jgi:hypothetical protein
MSAFDDTITPFVPVILIGLVLLLLVVGHLRSFRRAPIEEGKSPIYTGWVGGGVGTVSYRGPLINFRVYEDFMVIDAFRRTVLHFDSVDSVDLEKGLFFGSYLRITHHQPQAPEPILLSVSDPERVRDLIVGVLLQPGRSSGTT